MPQLHRLVISPLGPSVSLVLSLLFVPSSLFGRVSRTIAAERPAESIQNLCIDCHEAEVTAEPVSSEWQSSEDGKLSLRFISSLIEIPLGQDFVLTVELRNDSTEPVTILRPAVELEKLRLSYHRLTNLPLSGQLSDPGKPARSPNDAIAALVPGKVLRHEMLWRNEYWGDQKGRRAEHKFVFEYQVHDFERDQASRLGYPNVWTGRIVSEPLQVKRVLPGPEHASEPAWNASADGAVSFRLSAESQTVERTEPIVLVGEIRNDSSRTIRVFRPMVGLPGMFHNLVLVGPNGLLVYKGAAWDMTYGPESYIVLAPNEIASDRIELTERDYIDFNVPGPVLIFYRYHCFPLWWVREEKTGPELSQRTRSLYIESRQVSKPALCGKLLAASWRSDQYDSRCAVR